MLLKNLYKRRPWTKINCKLKKCGSRSCSRPVSGTLMTGEETLKDDPKIIEYKRNHERDRRGQKITT